MNMRKAVILVLFSLLIPVSVACSGDQEEDHSGAEVSPSLRREDKETLYGFFPSPPELTLESVFETYDNLGRHGDAVLYQQEIPWKEFRDSSDAESRSITDMANQQILAHQQNLEGIYVIDPLNGLNRREFQGLPFGWKADFANPDIRSAYKNFTLRILREFKPRYLGLASEINTYVDAFPEDLPNFLSLYNEVYDAIKAESPDTQVFVTFQWEDLNNLWRQPFESDYQEGVVKWHLIEMFEPKLDLWVISTYPYIVFENATDVPEDYYLPLWERTDKKLAVAEGGWISNDHEHLKASESDQEEYLKSIETQLGGRLDFWIYLLIQDIRVESYSRYIRGDDLDTLGFFTTVGLIDVNGAPKTALETWNQIRQE